MSLNSYLPAWLGGGSLDVRLSMDVAALLIYFAIVVFAWFAAKLSAKYSNDLVNLCGAQDMLNSGDPRRD